MLKRLRDGDERAAIETGLDDQQAMAPAADDPVAHRKRLAVGLDLHRKFGNDCAIAAANFLRKRGVLRRIKFRQTGTDHGDRAALRCQRALMRGGVDSARQTADDSEARIGELIGKFLGGFHPVMRRAPRADDSDGVLIALGQFAPNVEHDRRRMDLAELARIEWRIACDDIRAERANTFEFRRQIHDGFPADNLIRDVVADSFDRAQGISLRRENALGRFKNFEELAQSHRPHCREHVERDAGFGGGHRLRSR